MSDPEFRSQRAIDEELRRYKYAAFDKMVDLALDGVVSMDEAIKGFEEQLEQDQPSESV